MRIWPNDLDTNLHLNNGRYLTLMDIGRFDLSMQTGLLQESVKRKWFPVLGSAHIVFRRSLQPFQKVELRTRIVWWDEKWFYMEQNFVHKGDICSRALVRGVFRHKGKNVPVRTIMEAMGFPPQFPECPPAIKHWIELEASLSKLDTVDYSDLVAQARREGSVPPSA